MISPHTVIIPGDVTIDLVSAVERALARLPRVRNPTQASGLYLGRARQKINGLTPSVRQIFRVPVYQKRTGLPIEPVAYETSEGKARRVKRELIDAGATFYGLMKSESKILPKLLHNDEHVEAVVYGQHHSSSVMLVATSERILFVDKKPMALYLDEVSYEVISGIEFEIHTLFASLTLHTPVKNYDIRYANLHCAQRFAKHIEAHRLKREEAIGEKPEVQLPLPRNVRLNPNELKEDMAGYYWLPTEEEERRKIQEGLV